jgi:cell filamentation protein, protein adenylyltransferase
MKRGVQGTYVTCTTASELYQAFHPMPLPPDPEVQVPESLYDKALLSLGRLDSITILLPGPDLFLYLYVRKEALLSSQIEGTQSSLSDLLLYEAHSVPGVPLDDVAEVSTYVAALNQGLKLNREDGIPLCNRVLRQVHKTLLSKGRGSVKNPGNFRKSQVWVGGKSFRDAVFVPPPHEEIVPCMGDLEKFINDASIRPLIKAALAHVQFETIHPFSDGNGRLGRLLITLILCSEGILSEPLLYLSLYFKTHRTEYYDLLQHVRTTGDWERWIEFFLTGIIETSSQAIVTAQRLHKQFEQDKMRIERVGRAAPNTLRVHDLMTRNPVIKIGQAAALLELSPPTVISAMRRLETLGIVREMTGRKRDRTYAYIDYLGILQEGTEPLPR